MSGSTKNARTPAANMAQRGTCIVAAVIQASCSTLIMSALKMTKTVRTVRRATTTEPNTPIHATSKRHDAMARSRYCEMCDTWVPANQKECRACGADTVKPEPDELPGRRRALDARFDQLVEFALGPRPE